MFTRACHWSHSWARLIQSIPPNAICLRFSLISSRLGLPSGVFWLFHQNPTCIPSLRACYIGCITLTILELSRIEVLSAPVILNIFVTQTYLRQKYEALADRDTRFVAILMEIARISKCIDLCSKFRKINLAPIDFVKTPDWQPCILQRKCGKAVLRLQKC
jgi:hypothetical protein